MAHTELNPELLRQLADDLEKRPSEECWEFFYADGIKVISTPAWALEKIALAYYTEVRRKPATITRTVTVPKPKSETTLTGGEPGHYCLNVMSGLFWYENEQDRDDAAETILSLLRGD